MSGTTPTDSYTGALGHLGRQETEREFFESLTTLVQEHLGRREFTIASSAKDEFRLLFSNRWQSEETRLRSPILEPAAVAAVREAVETEKWIGPVQATASLEVEGVSLPVVRVWKLGSREGDDAHILFHDDGDDGEWPCGEENVRRIGLGITAAFYRFFETLRLREETDLLRAKLEAINEMGELIGSLDLEVLLTKLMELSLYVVQGQVGSIILTSAEDGSYDSPIEWGLPLEMAEIFKATDGRPVYQAVIESGTSVKALDFGDGCEVRIDHPEAHVDSYFCLPLVSKKRILGAVNLVNASRTGMDDEVLMTICSLAATSIENALLYKDSLEKERYEESLKIARHIQKKLYPAQAPAIDGFDIASRTESCDETGGDYYDYLPLDGAEGMTMVIGDVSGHGIGAALHMVAARSGLRATCGSQASLKEIIEQLNDQLEHDMEVEQFMTMFVASVPVAGEIEFVNCGHDAPCLFRRATGKLETLDSTGMPLGLFPGMPYEIGSVPAMEPGDVLLSMTDGVWEVHNPEGDMLGKEPLEEIFAELCRTHETADEIADGILETVAEYTAGSPQRDDVTLVILRAT
ncbi:MAG: GAF domain-containing SpoIIE family protein phosphatase [Planctomycetota bacterium]